MTSVYRVVESPIGPLTLVGAIRGAGGEEPEKKPAQGAQAGARGAQAGARDADSGARGGQAAIRAIWFSSSRTDDRLDPHARPIAPPADSVPDDGALDEAAHQLAEYFRGERKDFDLTLEPIGTEFQRQVWNELCRIPYGKAISYRELAERVGNPNAVRAVGGANGKNPIPIVIPCHRVIASDGSLAGFGGGVPAKQFLLDLEGVRIPSARDQMTIGVPGTHSAR